jgi:asparaginyl-tRNA synthetase
MFLFEELHCVLVQVIIDKAVYPLGKLTPTGTSITVVGTLAKTPPGTKQEVELRALKVIHVGSSDPSTYPIAKTKLSLEFLRSVQHLRARTNTVRRRIHLPMVLIEDSIAMLL